MLRMPVSSIPSSRPLPTIGRSHAASKVLQRKGKVHLGPFLAFFGDLHFSSSSKNWPLLSSFQDVAKALSRSAKGELIAGRRYSSHQRNCGDSLVRKQLFRLKTRLYRAVKFNLYQLNKQASTITAEILQTSRSTGRDVLVEVEDVFGVILIFQRC